MGSLDMYYDLHILMYLHASHAVWKFIESIIHILQIRIFEIQRRFFFLSYFPFWTLCPTRFGTMSDDSFYVLLLLCWYSSSVMETWGKFQIASPLGDKFWYHYDLCLCILNPFLRNCIALWNNNSNKNGREVKRLNKTSLMKQVNLR